MASHDHRSGTAEWTFHPLRSVFSAEELAFVKSFKVDELRVEAGASFLREGTRSEYLYTVLSGWAFRYKMLDDGRRQILNYALPADMLGFCKVL